MATARARVPRPKLDKCVLTVEEVFERDDVDDITGGARVRQIVPLGHADPGSVTVQQQEPNGSSFGFLSGQPWRVTFAMLDGSIRTDLDVFGRRSTDNDGHFDLIVSDRAAGAELIPHLQAAIMACQ